MKITYRTRLLMLIPGLLAFFLIIYRFSLAETISIRNEFVNKREILAELAENVGKVDELKERLDHLDQLLKIIEPAYSHQDIIIDFISDYCSKHDVRVTEIPGIHQYDYRDYVVITQQVTVEGTYSSLLLLLNALEKNYKNGRVRSVNYHVHENRRIKEKKLYMTLFFQILQHEKPDGTI